MKEIQDIVSAFHAAGREGKRTALATVVHVEGSSYRRPGARMLVSEDGRITGAISGGCLEGDALRKALHSIEQGSNRIAIYDTTDEDDLSFGIQLGCNGIVHILFEPIDVKREIHPVVFLEKLLAERKDAVLTTLFSLHAPAGAQPGTCLFYRGQEAMRLPSPLPHHRLMEDARGVLARQESLFKHYETPEGSLAGFIELVKPPVSLVIAGAGNDAMPLMRLADALGWRITLIDGRATHATAQRFPAADTIVTAKAETALEGVPSDGRTAFLVMTHNYRYDLAVLRQAMTKQSFYIGVLGPKEKLARMQDDLALEGVRFGAGVSRKIHGPTGLDIGAETPEEIAVSIIAEIGAVLNGREGGSLREREHPIHVRAFRHAG